ncbi:MAG TPA: hypothetical protein VNO14_01340 [Blastocatellia bacterium]|nr:hypothetical protein [Blastocatellia bacterium]
MKSSMILYLVLMFQQIPQHPKMTLSGWLFLIVSWVAILWVTFYTFARILRKR